MAFWLTMLVAMLMHSCYKGSKVLASLFAIDLGAGAATIGVLYAVYSVFAVVLSFFAGKATDRYGFRLPILFGASGLLLSLLVPYFFPTCAPCSPRRLSQACATSSTSSPSSIWSAP